MPSVVKRQVRRSKHNKRERFTPEKGFYLVESKASFGKTPRREWNELGKRARGRQSCDGETRSYRESGHRRQASAGRRDPHATVVEAQRKVPTKHEGSQRSDRKRAVAGRVPLRGGGGGELAVKTNRQGGRRAGSS